MSLEHPTFGFIPDFTSPPRFGIATNHDRSALGQARQTVSFPQRRPDYIFAHRFAIETEFEIQQLKEFFRERAGRAHPFFLPSWRRDLTLAVASVDEGDKQIPILSANEDYEATHLDGTDPDHYGRTLYFWKDGEEIWTERVIRVLPGAEAGQEILDLDTPLPFDIDDRTWIGWAHLVRFAEDTLEWMHYLPSAAETDITFRATRHANQNQLYVELEQHDQYGQLGFIEATVAPGEILPVTTRVAYAYGPTTLHNSQDGPYAITWAVWPADDGVRIRKAPDPIWLPYNAGSLSILFDDPIETDHIALAFDQNAYEVVAYQKDDETIECRRFFNTAVEIVEWAGQDPILQFNGLLDQDLETGETDVVCYYIKPGSNALWMRFQRDNFETEYLAALLPGRPLMLKRAYFEYSEDQSAGTLKVEFVDAGYRVGVLSSALYPDPPPPPVPPFVEYDDGDDAEVGAMSMAALVHTYAVMWADGGGEFDPHPPFEDAGTVTAALLGDSTAVIVYADGADLLDPHPPFEDVGETAARILITHAVQALSPTGDLLDAGQTSMSLDGELELTVIFPPISDENAQTNTSLTGTYAPA